MTEVTTARILADKALQEPCGQECVDWAVSMLTAGSDGANLTMLASMAPPYNHFEVAGFRDRALAEVGAPNLGVDDAVQVYAAERLRLALRGKANMLGTLRVVKDLCVAHDYQRDLYDFYLLYFAADSLRGSVHQSYWDSATRANIDDIVREQAQRFIAHTLGVT